MKLSTYDVVVLANSIPEEGLIKGMIGTVIDVHSSLAVAYEVEFCDQHGRTIASLALAPEQLEHNP